MNGQIGDLGNGDVMKRCACCGHPWQTRDVFLGDPQVAVVGYQVNFDDLLLGLFLFDHLACESTMALPAGLFTDLYDGPVYAGRATGTDDCPEYCLRKGELEPCPAKCECAYVREVLQIIRRWPKTSHGHD